MFNKTILKNGLRVITVPEKDAQTITVLILVGTGSRYETRYINGISHFLEHMFFKGTKKRPDTIAIAETLDRVGGIYNAFTGEEYTGYFAKVDARHLDLALDWISDIFLNSKIDSKEVEKGKGVIIEEINMYVDNPASFVQTLWGRLLYGDQPAGWDIAGSKETVSAMNRKKLVAYLRSQYVASNTIVCVAGKIDSSIIEKKIVGYFSGVTKNPYQKKIPVTEAQKDPACLLHERKTDQSHICLGVRGYSLFSPQKYSQEVLATILGGMMSSRLFIKVREELGLAYYINSGADTSTDSGFLVTQAGIDNSKIELGIKTIVNEYKKISREKVPASELKKAKDFLKGKTALLLESSDAKASFYGIQELLEGRVLTPEEMYDKINKVTSNDVLEVAKNLFRPEKLNLAILGPFDDKKKFSRLLSFK